MPIKNDRHQPHL